MIVVPLNTVAYRVHQPKWSFAPTSGAGAGTYGGRANRPGVNALHVSLELETALAEYQQLDALMPPGLMVSYNVSVDAVVDFRGGYTINWNPLWQDFYCDWRNMHFNQGIEPPSWVISDQVLAGADAIAVHDPDHALPKNQQSWE